ncbi:hypothetical protein NQ315_007924 [Exocentrus adspersus]|uniref:Uncharacterized protein n=1 Tax=Exocentrus adspersus TaxID=1586481 RepID=A0AAV8W8U0_9CUCU|nr:hypothetical protein NQ315_007924 [Exocentrus adspersus]
MLFSVITLIIISNASGENKNFSVLDTLKSGFQLASKFFTSDHAKGVANLVSEAFEKSSTNKANNHEKHSNVFSGFLRISSAIHLKRPSRITYEKKTDTGSLFDWVLSNTAVEDLLTNAQDEKLPEKVIEYVKDRSLDEDSGCIQLLICKSAPFISKMQKSIKERSRNSTLGYSALYKYLPTVEEVSDHGDDCEKKFPYCIIPL